MRPYFLYILKSRLNGRHYIGVTEDSTARLHKHNSGSVTSTKAYRPWQMVHKEEFRDKTSARRRELFLKKTARARKELFKRFK